MKHLNIFITIFVAGALSLPSGAAEKCEEYDLEVGKVKKMSGDLGYKNDVSSFISIWKCKSKIYDPGLAKAANTKKVSLQGIYCNSASPTLKKVSDFINSTNEALELNPAHDAQTIQIVGQLKSTYAEICPKDASKYLKDGDAKMVELNNKFGALITEITLFDNFNSARKSISREYFGEKKELKLSLPLSDGLQKLDALNRPKNTQEWNTVLYTSNGDGAPVKKEYIEEPNAIYSDENGVGTNIFSVRHTYDGDLVSDTKTEIRFNPAGIAGATGLYIVDRFKEGADKQENAGPNAN